MRLLPGFLSRHRRQESRRRAVYTAIFGHYDGLKTHPRVEGADFICFTDDASLQSADWQLRVSRPLYAHPRLSAKYFKMLAHVVLPEHDETLWIDATLLLKGADVISEAFSHLAEHPIAMFAHPERNCIYAEAAYCADMPKYRGQNIQGQIDWYKRRLPTRQRVVRRRVIARRSDDAKIRKLDRLWLRDNEQWTYQDQLSFPVVAEQLGLRPAIFPHDLWKNPWFEYIPHATDL